MQYMLLQTHCTHYNLISALCRVFLPFLLSPPSENKVKSKDYLNIQFSPRIRVKLILIRFIGKLYLKALTISKFEHCNNMQLTCYVSQLFWLKIPQFFWAQLITFFGYFFCYQLIHLDKNHVVIHSIFKIMSFSKVSIKSCRYPQYLYNHVVIHSIFKKSCRFPKYL